MSVDQGCIGVCKAGCNQERRGWTRLRGWSTVIQYTHIYIQYIYIQIQYIIQIQCLIRSCRRKYSRINVLVNILNPLEAVKTNWNHQYIICITYIQIQYIYIQISQVDLSSLAQDRDGIFQLGISTFANDWNPLIKLSVTQVLASDQLVKLCKQPKSLNLCVRWRSISCISKTTIFTWWSESAFFFIHNPSILLLVWSFQKFRCKIKVELSDNGGKFADFLTPNIVFPNYSQN